MESEKPPSRADIQLSDFVGDYGAYQFAVTVLLFARYAALGLMANSGPLLTPDVAFYCRLPADEVRALMPNLTALSAHQQQLELKHQFKRICQLDRHLYQDNQQQAQRQCPHFDFELAPDQGRTMTSEFELVCERDWLRSLYQSLLSAAIVVAHVFWGTFSDRHGRFQAQRLCLIVSLLAGLSSLFAPDFWSFALARAVVSFGDLGLVVSLTTVVVELVGSRYRGLSVAVVNFGFALGVTLLPYVVAYFEDFRLVVAFTVLCHALTFPFVLMTDESVRWLLTNRKFQLARKELRRIVSWNRKARRVARSLAALASLSPIGKLGAGGQQQANKAAESPEQRRGQKKAFDLLYARFIQQIESQNFCDPLNQPQAGDAIPPDPPTSSSASGSTPSPEPQQAAVDLDKQQQLAPPPARDKTRPPNAGPPLELARVWLGSSARVSLDSATTDKGSARLSPPRPPQETNSSGPPLALRKAASFNQVFHLTQAPAELEAGAIERCPLARRATPPSAGKCGPSGAVIAVEEALEEQRRAERQQQQQQPDCINLVAHQLSFVTRVSRLFRDKKLMVAVFTIVWTTFNSELQYTSYIIINLEVGEDVYLNYILGGCMEALAAITASVLLSYAPRRASLIAFWLLISLACFGLSVAHIDSTWAVWLLALAKFSQSCLSSIASVAAYESFPTFLRQSGSGLVFTLGMLGSVFAPLIFAEFDDQAGMDNVLMTFSVSSLTAAILIYLFLQETRDCELK